MKLINNQQMSCFVLKSGGLGDKRLVSKGILYLSVGTKQPLFGFYVKTRSA